ncbi:MAG: type-F conjugative transfer system secretin TraK [Desulfosalsimonadaceae bacterium]
MISKNLKIKAGVFLLFALFLCGSAIAATPAYTVRLGEFKTIPAVTEFYRLVPEKHHPNTTVCRQGDVYVLNCGSYAQEKDIQPLFIQLKDLGLNPKIVKADASNCSPADAFLKFTQLPPLPPPIPAVKQEPYSDLNDPEVASQMENRRTLLPETTTSIVFSNRDVNRIICQAGPIKDVVFSQEKGISVKTSASNAFVKFLMSGDENAGGLTYSDTPSEIYVVCGPDNDVYTLIAEPRNIPAQTIELASRKKDIQKTISLFDGLAFEKKIILMISLAYKNDTDSLTVKPVNTPLNVFRDMDVLFSRQITADGEGLTVNEYILSIKPTSAKTSLPINETMFLVPELTQKPVGVALEHMSLTMGNPSRLFMVETHTD